VIAAPSELAATRINTPPLPGAAAGGLPGASPGEALADTFWSFLDDCCEPDCPVPWSGTDRRPAPYQKREREGQTAPAAAVVQMVPSPPPVPAVNPLDIRTGSGPDSALSRQGPAEDAAAEGARAASELAFAARLIVPDPLPQARAAGTRGGESSNITPPGAPVAVLAGATVAGKAGAEPAEDTNSDASEPPPPRHIAPPAAGAADAPPAAEEIRGRQNEAVRASRPEPGLDAGPALTVPSGTEGPPARVSRAPEAGASRPSEPEPPPPAPAPRDVSVRLSDGPRSVDIRMAERSGEIRVVVHTPDRDLATSLRGDLPDLVGRLRQSGFQAEAWRPAPAQEADPGRRSGTQDFSGFSQQHSARHPGEGRRQQPHDQPRWAGEWNASLDPAQESSR
jgi:hypothetical protein